MRTQSIDTSPEFERVQIAHLRTFSPARKFASTRSWTHSIAAMSRYARSKFPQKLSKQDIVQIISREYGRDLANVFQKNQEQETFVTPDPDIQSALLTVISIFNRLGIHYALTGSLACSIYGFPRSIQDVDSIADIFPEHLTPLIAALQQDFMFDEHQILQSIEQSTFFSLLHLSSLFRVDILLPANTFEQQALQQKQSVMLIEEKPLVDMLTPEDVLLMHLMWYQHTGAVADDQWNDILGLLKVQSLNLNIKYLHENSVALHVAELLSQGLSDAGIDEA